MGGAFFLSPYIVFSIPLCSKVEKLGGVFKLRSLRVEELSGRFYELNSQRYLLNFSTLQLLNLKSCPPLCELVVDVHFAF